MEFRKWLNNFLHPDNSSRENYFKLVLEPPAKGLFIYVIFSLFYLFLEIGDKIFKVIFSDSYSFIIFLIVLIVVLIAYMLILPLFIKNIKKQKLFQSTANLYYSLWVIIWAVIWVILGSQIRQENVPIYLLVTLLVMICFKLLVNRNNKKHEEITEPFFLKFSFLIMVLFISVFLYIGAISIYYFTGGDSYQFSLSLNNCSSHQKFENAEIKCENTLGNIFVDSKVICGLKNIELKNISGFFKFTLLNGSVETQNFDKEISFIVPSNVGGLYVEINGTYNGTEICLSSGIPITFGTYEEYQQCKKDVVTYFMALIVFILLTIPTIYKNWKELIEELFKKEDTKEQTT